MTSFLEAVSKPIRGGWGRPQGAPRTLNTGGGSLRSTPAIPIDSLILKWLLKTIAGYRLAVVVHCVMLTVCCAPLTAAEPVPANIAITPSVVELNGPHATARLLVTGTFAAGAVADLTRDVTYESLSPKVVTVSKSGVLSPRGNGPAEILARYGALETRVAVTVNDIAIPQPVDFRTEVIGALSRGGCNQGACHGSPKGKDGFRLSLRGFQPELDFMTLTRENFGRRTNPTNAEASLFLKKAAGAIPHQGGRRFAKTDPAYKTLLRWVDEGVPDSKTTLILKRLEVLPGHTLLHVSKPIQQMVARAYFDDGSVRDVTHLAAFSSSDEESATVSADGLVEFHRTAEVAVLVRYLQRIESVRLTYVRTDPAFAATNQPEKNYVDTFSFAKQRALQLKPSPLATDPVFLRRVHLDLIGVLPTPEEAVAFLDSADPQKREKLIDNLLTREEFAYFWAMKWADVVRGNREAITERGLHSFHRYLVRLFAEDRPLDRFAREILTSLGNTINNPPANFFRISRKPEEAAESMSQLFLGVRIQCAKCHNHPYETITQDDYYGLAAYFARVRYKQQTFGLDDGVVFLARSGDVKHSSTGKVVQPAAFGKPMGEIGPGEDRRTKLADWLATPANPYFARSTVNRVWYHLLGRGIVEPIDDFRNSNPPANAQLLDALSDDFVKHGFRVKPIIRTIVNSRTYQLSAEPVTQLKDAAKPEKYFTRAKVQMLAAEQILDAISSATGVPEKFPGYPPGTRALELAEGAIDHNFLKAFSRPIRDIACDCARDTEPSLNQVIHLLNNPGILAKFSAPGGRLSRLLKADTPTPQIVETLYLATLSRRPTASETKLTADYIARFNNRGEGLRDLAHALINSNEFLLRH